MKYFPLNLEKNFASNSGGSSIAITVRFKFELNFFSDFFIKHIIPQEFTQPVVNRNLSECQTWNIMTCNKVKGIDLFFV